MRRHGHADCFHPNDSCPITIVIDFPRRTEAIPVSADGPLCLIRPTMTDPLRW